MDAISQGAGDPSAGAESEEQTGPVPETFLSVVLRRARYVIAMAVCAYLFYTLGWALIAPAQIPGMAAASFLLGPSAAGLIAALCITVLLLVTIAISMAIVHPDVPHIGLYCAGIGLAALSIRGGSITLIVDQAGVGRLWDQGQMADAAGQQAALFMRLIAECALWVVILFFADAYCLVLFRRIFKSVKWLIRSGSSDDTPAILFKHAPICPVVDLTLVAAGVAPNGALPSKSALPKTTKAAALQQIAIGAILLGIGLVVTLGSFSIARNGGVYLVTWGAIVAGALQLIRGLGNALEGYFHPNIGALLVMILSASALLMILMRSELKGQVLFACLASFGLAAFVAQQMFPRAATWPFWVAVPMTAAMGYAIARNQPMPYPGHVALQLARGLPMDYIAAGVPGAVLGYYASLRWQIHQIVHEQ